MCNQDTMNTRIEASSARIAIEVLRDVPLVVPPRDVPLAFVLTPRRMKLARGTQEVSCTKEEGCT